MAWSPWTSAASSIKWANKQPLWLLYGLRRLSAASCAGGGHAPAFSLLPWKRPGQGTECGVISPESTAESSRPARSASARTPSCAIRTGTSARLPPGGLSCSLWARGPHSCVKAPKVPAGEGRGGEGGALVRRGGMCVLLGFAGSEVLFLGEALARTCSAAPGRSSLGAWQVPLITFLSVLILY